MQNLISKYTALNFSNKFSFWVVILISFVLSGYSIGFITNLPELSYDQILVIYLAPLIIGIFSLVSAGYILLGKPSLGGWILFLSNLFGMLFITSITKGYGLTPAVWVLIVTIFIPLQILPADHKKRLIIFALLGFSALILIDTFGKFNRVMISPLETKVADYIASGMGFLLLAYFVITYRRYPLRIKLILSFLGLTILSVGVVSLQSITINTRNLTENVGARMSQIANSNGLSIGNELYRLVSLLSTISLNTNLQDNIKIIMNSYPEDTREIRDYLKNLDAAWQESISNDRSLPIIYDRLTNNVAIELRTLSYRIPSLGNLFVTDRYGGLVGSLKSLDTFALFNQPWWEKVYNNGDGGIFIGRPEYDPNLKSYSILIVVPVFDRIGNYFLGAIGTRVPLNIFVEHFEDEANNLGLNASINILFSGTTYSLLNTRTDMNSWDFDNTTKQDNEFYQEIIRLGNENSYFKQIIGGKESFVSIANITDQENSEYIEDLGWNILVYNPLEDALQQVQTQQRATIAIILVIGLIATIGALGISQHLAGPIQRLSQAARIFGSGNYKTRAIIESSDEIGNLAITFNTMADQINQNLQSLEEQVKERTKAIMISAEISRRLSTILDQHQLILAVVEEIQQSFNFYHVHIYLLDESIGVLNLVGGTGDAGQKMMDRKHKIELGQGIVGRSAQLNKPILVPDTRNDPVWMPNPLLPDTKSELAIPIAIGNHILGVLDVQENIVNGLSLQTSELLQSIANQVAIAVNNARLFAEAQFKADQESIILGITQKIQSANSIEGVLETTARELGIALGSQKTSVIIEINEGWATTYLADLGDKVGYIYDNNQVTHINPETIIPHKDDFISKNLSVRGEGIGELVISGFENFDDYTEELINDVVEQLCNHLENLRLSEQTQRALRETDILYTIISELNAVQNYDEILKVLSQHTILNHADQSLIVFTFDKPFSPNSNPEWIIPVSAKLKPNIMLADRYPLSAFEITPNTIFTNSTIVIENVKVDQRLDRLTNTLFKNVFHAESSIIVPLIIGQQSLGFIMGNFGIVQTFNVREIQRLSTIASQIAVAIQSMQLLEKTLNRAKREELLREVTNQINNAAGTDAILRKTAEQVGNALKRPVYVYLGDTDSGNGNNRKILNSEQLD